eukprot:4856551-Amphidinium_carterae.1
MYHRHRPKAPKPDKQKRDRNFLFRPVEAALASTVLSIEKPLASRSLRKTKIEHRSNPLLLVPLPGLGVKA